MSNTNELINFVERVNKKFLKVKGNEELSSKTLVEFSTILRKIIINGEFTNINKYPDIYENIAAVVNKEGIQLTESDYEFLIDSVLNFSYSDYNESISDLVTSYLEKK